MIPGALSFAVHSLKNELRIVGGVIILLGILPLFGVVVLANAGISDAALALTGVNPISHHVEIRNSNGVVTNSYSASTVWPAHGVVTLEFGQADPPFGIPHTGIDIAAKSGDSITPFMSGTVIRSIHGTTGFGNYVMLDHGSGLVSLYGHMSVISADAGTVVKPGDTIGLEGSTGNSTGPHVHFEIRILGIPVNPRLFMVGNP